MSDDPMGDVMAAVDALNRKLALVIIDDPGAALAQVPNLRAARQAVSRAVAALVLRELERFDRPDQVDTELSKRAAYWRKRAAIEEGE